MEAIGWFLGGLMSFLGAFWTLRRHPRWGGKLTGILPPLLWCTAIFAMTTHEWQRELTPFFYATYVLVLPIVAGFCGAFLASNAEHERDAAAVAHLAPPTNPSK